jgi:hypothetical protein
MFSNLRRHGAQMPAPQAEKLIAMIELAAKPYVVAREDEGEALAAPAVAETQVAPLSSARPEAASQE